MKTTSQATRWLLPFCLAASTAFLAGCYTSTRDTALVGKRVVVVRSDASFVNDNSGLVARAKIGEAYEVTEAKHGYLRLKEPDLWIERVEVEAEEDAESHFDSRIKAYPYAWYYLGRARVRARGNNREGALQDLNASIGLNPKNAEPLWQRALILRSSGELDRAMADLNAALAMNSNSVEGFTTRGLVWKDKGDFDKAIADFDEAIRLNPQYGSAYANRGLVWLEKDEPEKCIADLDAAVRLSPRSAKVYNSRGHAWHKIGDDEKALADLTEAVSIQPDFAVAYYNRGDVWHDKGDFARAIREYNFALECNPKYADVYVDRGIVWTELTEYEKAVKDFESALDANPKMEVAHDRLAHLLATCPDSRYRDGARAIVHATRSCELTNWKRASCIAVLAAAHAEAGDFDQAVVFEQKASELLPESKRREYLARLKSYQDHQPLPDHLVP